MKIIRWDEDKNDWLKRTRGVGFEQVAVLIARGAVLEIVENSNRERYPHQKIAIVNIEGYAYLVPYGHVGDGVFLKTIIPSRKATRQYLRGEHEEETRA